MSTKAEPGRFDAYGKAEEHEPIFALLGRDPAAPELIRAWVRRHQSLGTEGIKLMEALDVADQMEKYLMERNARPQPPVLKADD